MNVILVDDEEDFRNPVKTFLDSVGFNTRDASSISGLRRIRKTFKPDIIILDINLPGESGLSALREIRNDKNIGIILVSARKGPADRVLGLSLGADYYLEKPIDFHELEIIARKIQERISWSKADENSSWVFNADDWTLKSPEGEVVHLSAAEYTVVAELSSQAGEPMSRDILLQAMDKYKAIGSDRTLDVLISRLRKKFIETKSTLPLRSARGIGYVFADVTVRGTIRTLGNQAHSNQETYKIKEA